MESSFTSWPSSLPAPLLGRRHRLEPRTKLTMMESGRVRARPSFEEAVEFLEVQWNFTEDQYETFETFFYEDLVNGSLSFVLETMDPAPGGGYQAINRALSFWEGSFSFSHSDNLYSVAAILEVVETEIEAEDLCKIEFTDADGGGDNFDCYLSNLRVNGLASGSYFTGAWVDQPQFIGVIDEDSLDFYDDDVAINGLSEGDVWSGNWTDASLYAGLSASASFDSFSDDVALDGLEAGDGFDGAWADDELG